MTHRRRSPSPLRDHPNFRLLLSARLTDTAGNAVAPIALAFAVLDLTGSAGDVGLVVGARSLALVVLLVLGGVVADRWPRSVVLVWSNLLSACTQAAIATLVLLDTATVPLLIGLSLVNGGAAAVSFPAAGALVVGTVPKPLLQRANATLASATSTVNLIGLVVGAALIAAVGPGWGLALDASSFAATAALFHRLRIPGRALESGSILDDLREGWSAFVSRSWIWTTVLGFLVINATYVGAISVLGPTIADESLGRAQWGWILGGQAVGVLTITMLLSRASRPLTLAGGVASAVLVAPWIFVLGVSPNVPLLLVTSFLAGIGFGYFGTAWETNLQANVAGEHLSRVYSFDMVGSILAMPIGQVAIGPIADAVGRRSTLLGAAALTVLACMAALAMPSIRRLPAPDLDRVDPSNLVA